MIAAQLPDGDLAELLEWAEELSAKELDTFIRRKTTTGKRCVLLYFSPADYRQYEKAALKCGAAKRGKGLTGKEAAIIKMATNELRR
jgi:hypothetical protein